MRGSEGRKIRREGKEGRRGKDGGEVRIILENGRGI